MEEGARIEQAINYVRDNFAEKITLEQVAAMANYSPFHFHRLFKQATSETLNQYIKRVRLEHAAHLITLYPYKSMAEVATESGFNSIAAFSREYKKEFNISPSQAHAPNVKNVLGIIEQQTSLESPFIENVEVKFMPTLYIHCKLFSAFDSSLNQYFSELTIDEALTTTGSSCIRAGIFVDNIIHTPIDKCRYYAGVVVDKNLVKKNTKSIYMMEEGKYAVISITGSWQEVIATIIKFKLQWIDKSKYDIRTTVGFEIIEWMPGVAYEQLNKRLYIPIKARA